MIFFDKIVHILSKVYIGINPLDRILVGIMGLVLLNIPFVMWAHSDPHGNIVILRAVSSAFSFLFIFHQNFITERSPLGGCIWLGYICLAFLFCPALVLYHNYMSYEWILNLVVALMVLSYVVSTSLYFLSSFILISCICLFFDISTKQMESLFLGWIVASIFSALFFKRRRAHEAELKRVYRSSVSTIAHEMRTPLASICLLSDLIMRRKEKNELARKITNIASTASRAVGNFSDFVTEGEFSKCSKAIRVDELVKRVLDENKQILFPIIHFESKIDREVQIDPNLLYGVILNILKNATTFCLKKKGSQIFVKIAQDSKNTKILIKDTGLGIQKKDLPFIYDSFFSEREGGVGLGLYFCKNVIEKMGGSISCTSKFGKFTQFEIDFGREL